LVAFGPPAEALARPNLERAFGSSLLITDGGALLVDECCPPEEH
jgi:hypothetical protein